MRLSRRQMIACAAAAALPQRVRAATPLEIGWDDLIPPGVPYSEIIAEGIVDEAADTWLPVFDANATKLNPALDGALIRMPGFIIPMDLSLRGVTSFILVPYVGACIHTPPPPANQLVFVKTQTPWPSDDLWAAVWVTGVMGHGVQMTQIAQTGYTMDATLIEIYEW